MKNTAIHLLLWTVLATVQTFGQGPRLPQFIELDIGESAAIQLPNGQSKQLKLVSVKEHSEPYYQSATKSVVDAVARVEMVVDVDGVTGSIEGGPFHMPAEVNGLAILMSNSRGLSGGIRPDEIAKAVRFEVADSVNAWTEPWKLTYPIRNYRWHAMNYQHTYLGVAVNQAKLYFHRGEDMGMIADHELAVAIADGVVKQIPGPKGDGASNAVILANEAGFDIRYAHMNTPYIFPRLQPGVALRSGAPLGLTGNTWNGGPVRDPHLHWNLDDSATGTIRNPFPLAVEAFRRSFPEEPLPIAGGWRHVYAGGSLRLDGSLSLAAKGQVLRDYEWTFTDGTTAKGKAVTREYTTPGTYSEALTVTDGSGRRDTDFVEVFVLPRNPLRPPPFAWINYFPVRNIKPGTEIEFLTRFSNMKDVTIDFGDGRVEPWAENLTHAYKNRGAYLVTVRGKDDGAGPGIFHVRVYVD